MLVRIVKMSFHPNHVDTFLQHFETHKQHIRHFEGCQLLELYQDQQQKHIFFTYSYWQSAQHLEDYRHSNLFKTVWAVTKPLFNDQPQAWSVDKVVTLK